MDVKDILKRGELRITYIKMGRLTRVSRQKKITFLEFSDGSCSETLKCVYEGQLSEEFGEGDSVRIEGQVVKAPEKASQKVELQLQKIEMIDPVRDRGSYEYGSSAFKKRTPEDNMKHLTALRGKTFTRFMDPVQASLIRVRGIVKNSLIRFFEDLGFVPFDPPIITSSDCEGAGEMFTVTSLSDSPPTLDGKIDYTQDFFGRKVGLTVSGQLEAEAGAKAFQKVYTFGPTFRAEHSSTGRHLASFGC